MSEEAISVAGQAEAAGRPRTDLTDPITELRNHCKAFIEGANMPTHQRSMALVKCDELIFWIRAGAGRG